jgi:hypothetical protein
MIFNNLLFIINNYPSDINSCSSCFILKSCLLNRFSICIISFSGSESKLLSLMVDAEALRVLVQAGERPALVIWLDALHLDDLGPRENIGELNRASALLLVLDDLPDVFFN